MSPTLTDYLNGLRRLWWIPLLAVLAGLGAGLILASATRATTETRGSVLFTFRVEDPGQEAAGSARIAESEIAASRLTGYVAIARASEEIDRLLGDAGITAAPTTFGTTGGFKDASARVLIDVPAASGTGSGLVEVRLKDGDLGPAESSELVTAIAASVARQAVATDAVQESPSLRPEPLIATPQAIEVPASRMMKLALPVLLLAMLGLGLVYVVVWRQGRVYARRDIEERVGARVLGELLGGPADAPAIVLALTKGRDEGTRALIAPVGATAGSDGALGRSLLAAGLELGLRVSLATPEESVMQPAPVTSIGAGSASDLDLTLIEARNGLDAAALQAVRSVDIVALAVTYGSSRYADLLSAGRTLAEVTDADVAVIGVDGG